MKSEPDSTERLAEKIDASERKLHLLDQELEALGEPASGALHHRLEAMKIEEHALQRNFAEFRQSEHPDEDRLRKVEALLRHIEAEEAAIEHEAEFLEQCAPTTLEFAYRIGSRFFDYGASSVKRVMGEHHLLWQSPFVNTTIESLSTRFNLPPGDEVETKGA